MFDKIIIVKYLSGNATADEQDLLFSWLEKSNRNRQLFSELKRIWIESAEKKEELFTSSGEAFQKFQKKIREHKDLPEIARATVWQRHNWLKYAANIAAIIAVGILTYILGVNQQRSTVDQRFSEIVVPYGGISSVLLPDSTTVWLHSGSKLRYGKDFGENNRDIHLEGEAYFDVVKNKDVPLIVRTSHMHIRALGTRFNVKSYPDDERVETTLEEGSIEITRIRGRILSQPIHLYPKEKFTLIKESSDATVTTPETSEKSKKEEVDKTLKLEPIKSRGIITSNVVVEESTAWKDGVYILKHKKLTEVVKVLERRYKVEISYDKSIQEYTYSGVLRDLTLEQVLDALKITSDLDYSIEERKVKLYLK